jgi:hypothetical protein
MLKDVDPAKAVLLAPLIFLLHVLEEAPGFVAWFNTLVREGITQPLFLAVNATALVITVALAAALAGTREKGAAIVTLTWLSCLMFANATFHVTATIVHRMYAPGVITAALLYLPYFTWFLWLVLRRYKIGVPSALGAVLVGAAPMFAHGYLIVFKGERLF